MRLQDFAEALFVAADASATASVDQLVDGALLHALSRSLLDVSC